MNRRKALGQLLLAGIGGTLAFGAFKWYDWNRTPDLPALEQRKELLAALADTILPPTGSGTAAIPGAREAGVQDFIILLLTDCTDRRTLNKFIAGLKDLEAYCLSAWHQPFTRCSDKTRQSILAHFENKDRPLTGIWGKAAGRYLGKPFFTTLKEYTVQAYCSSETGATRGLAYVPVPGSYQGCVPWRPGQPAWATK